MALTNAELAQKAHDLLVLTEQGRVTEKKREALKAELKAELANGTHTLGDVVVEIKVQARTNLDRKALEDALGEANIAPFLKMSTNRQIEVRPVLETQKAS